jgi:hypothetical protein
VPAAEIGPRAAGDASLPGGPPSLLPSPPWSLSGELLVWAHGARPSELRHLVPHGLATVLPVVVGGLARYVESPVGPYDEALAAVAVLDRGVVRGHVPFMAVDAPRSRDGGRRFWALSKELAFFDGWGVTGEGWSLDVRASVRGPALSARLPLPLLQQDAGGRPRRCVAWLSGRARLAAVAVRGDPGGLPEPLRAGTFPAVHVRGRLVVPAPRVG